MHTDLIAEISIDSDRRLRVRPLTQDFQYVYRAGMEVGWDNDGRFLYSPPPREWSNVQWFQQIVAAAKDEYGCTLVVSDETIWHNVEPSLQSAITAASPQAYV